MKKCCLRFRTFLYRTSLAAEAPEKWERTPKEEHFPQLAVYMYLLYNFVNKCPNNSQNEYKYRAIFGQLVICTLPV